MAHAPSSGPRGAKDHPLMDGHLAALLGGADADLLAAISIVALSGMRLDELRRLRVAHCGRGSFRVVLPEGRGLRSRPPFGPQPRDLPPEFVAVRGALLPPSFRAGERA